MPGVKIFDAIDMRSKTASPNPSREDELFKYISGIIKNKGQKPLALN
jgi:hypothetical protein